LESRSTFDPALFTPHSVNSVETFFTTSHFPPKIAPTVSYGETSAKGVIFGFERRRM
jgi:hypothetical protein